MWMFFRVKEQEVKKGKWVETAHGSASRPTTVPLLVHFRTYGHHNFLRTLFSVKADEGRTNNPLEGKPFQSPGRGNKSLALVSVRLICLTRRIELGLAEATWLLCTPSSLRFLGKNTASSLEVCTAAFEAASKQQQQPKTQST